MKTGHFIVCLLLMSIGVFAQEPSKKPLIQEIGFWPGFGYGNNTKSLPEGNYQPYFFLFHVAVKPFFKGDNNALERFQFYLEPQYNYVQLKGTNSTTKEYEFGLNIGAKYLFPIRPEWDLFMYISAGPHAFSATTSRQAPGYLFSDNMGMGLYYHFNQKWAGIFTYRIRHLSNADTRQPNHGINTDNFHFGVSCFFGLK